jgi:hypothetical protein
MQIFAASEPAGADTADLATAIREVAGQHKECDLVHPATPAAAVAVLRTDGRSLEYLVLGDVTVVLDGVDGLQIIVDDRVAATAAEHRQEAARPVEPFGHRVPPLKPLR